MIDQPDLLHQLPAILLAGVCTYVWLVARDRRKAVDRLVDRIERCSAPPTGSTFRCKLKREIREAGLDVDVAGGQCEDAPGRVIARSVKRMTKHDVV